MLTTHYQGKRIVVVKVGNAAPSYGWYMHTPHEDIITAGMAPTVTGALMDAFTAVRQPNHPRVYRGP